MMRIEATTALFFGCLGALAIVDDKPEDTLTKKTELLKDPITGGKVKVVFPQAPDARVAPVPPPAMPVAVKIQNPVDQKDKYRDPNVIEMMGMQQNCHFSPYGCCQDDLTPAIGPAYKGCDILDTIPALSCRDTVYGCCEDGVTIAKGPLNRGCAETIWREIDEQQLRRNGHGDYLKELEKSKNKVDKLKKDMVESMPKNSNKSRVKLDELTTDLDDIAKQNWYTVDGSK